MFPGGRLCSCRQGPQMQHGAMMGWEQDPRGGVDAVVGLLWGWWALMQTRACAPRNQLWLLSALLGVGSQAPPPTSCSVLGSRWRRSKKTGVWRCDVMYHLVRWLADPDCGYRPGRVWVGGLPAATSPSGHTDPPWSSVVSYPSACLRKVPQNRAPARACPVWLLSYPACRQVSAEQPLGGGTRKDSAWQGHQNPWGQR